MLFYIHNTFSMGQEHEMNQHTISSFSEQKMYTYEFMYISESL